MIPMLPLASRKVLMCIMLLIGICSHTQAQLIVNTGSPYQQYVSSLIGTGINVLNINIDCDTILPQMGEFNGAATNLGLANGTILSSGGVDDASNNGAFFASTGQNLPGDPNLDQQPGVLGTEDACAITIQFVPFCDTISIRYVFGSEEYPEFAPPNSSAFNDYFAFFISGPGVGTNVNVAVLPGTTTPVSINNVNAVTNNQYYVDNQTGIDIAYDGFTTVLEAKTYVQPCDTYTVKLVVADDGDDIYDSAVFLEAGGISCIGNPPPSATVGNTFNPLSPVAVEECVDGYFTFFNNGDTSVNLTIDFNIFGTATNGVDYNPIPNSITIPAGQDSINLIVSPISDGLLEGPETIQLVIFDTLCANAFTDTVTLTIEDPFVIDAGPDLITCSGDPVELGGPAIPGVTYTWGPNVGLDSLGVANPDFSLIIPPSAPPQIYPFTATGVSINGCVDTDDVAVTVVAPPSATFTMPQSVCENEIANILYLGGAPPNSTYTWSFPPGTQILSGAGAGPYQVVWPVAGTQTVTLQVETQGCFSDLVSQSVLVRPIPTSSFAATGPVCVGEGSSFVYTGTAGPTATYMYDLDGGTGMPGPGTFSVSWATPGLKEISLVVIENGCVSPATVLQVQVYEIPTNTFSAPATVCSGDTAQVVYQGSAPFTAAYIWDFDGAIIASGSGPGPYKLIWPTGGTRTICLQVQENGCLSPLACQPVIVFPKPNAGIAFVPDQCLAGNTFTFVSTGDANVDTYAWNFGSGANPGTSTAASPSSVTYIDPGMKTVSLVVTRDGCESDSATISFEVVEEPEANFSASTASICSDSCITFLYTGVSLGAGQTYLWDFGPNAVPQTSSLPNPGCVTFPGGNGMETVTLTVSRQNCTDVSIQQIQVQAVPQVSAGADVSFCEGSGGVQLNASVIAGASSQLFYEWTCDNPPNCGMSNAFVEDPIVLPTVSGALPQLVTYYFQVFDQNGCSSSIDSVEVEVKAKPKMNAGADVFICEDGPGAFLTGGVAANNEAPLPIQYEWIPAEGLSDAFVANPFARPDTTTIYTLIGASINGCSSVANTLDTLSTVTVHVQALPVANAGADTAMCLGDTIQLQGFGNASNGQYAYFWTPTPNFISNPGSATPLVSPPATTTFFLVVRAQGCDSYADSVTVIVDTKPTLSPGEDKTICLGDTVQLDGRASGDPAGAQYSYSWSPSIGLNDPAAGQPLASPEFTTTYQIVATSEHGCSSEMGEVLVTVESTPIVEALSADTVICEGTEIELAATHSFTTTSPGSPVTYRWLPQASVLGSNSLPVVSVSPASTTRYIVEASIAGDCPTTDEVWVTVAPAVFAEIKADTTRICKGESTQLYGVGGLGNASFEWSPSMGLDHANVQNPLASPDTSLTYSLIVREGVCADTVSLGIEVNKTPEADYFASQATGCEGLEVSFLDNSTDAIAFRWDFGDGSEVNNERNPHYVYAEAGTYPVTLTVTGEGGCESSISSTVVQTSEGSFADFGSDPGPGEVQPLPGAVVRFTNLASGGVNWLWDFGDGRSSADENPIHTYQDAGSYEVTLTITDENGCVSAVTYGAFEVVEPNLLIPNLITPNGDGINDVFEVMYTGKERFFLKVYDRWGKEHFVSSNPNEGWDGDAKEGVYFYRLEIGEKAYTGNITLMR